MIPSIYPGYFYTILSECKSSWLRKEADFIAFAVAHICAIRQADLFLLIDSAGEEAAVDDESLSGDIRRGI
jgi:hypothetical protein